MQTNAFLSITRNYGSGAPMDQLFVISLAHSNIGKITLLSQVGTFESAVDYLRNIRLVFDTANNYAWIDVYVNGDNLRYNNYFFTLSCFYGNDRVSAIYPIQSVPEAIPSGFSLITTYDIDPYLSNPRLVSLYIPYNKSGPRHYIDYTGTHQGAMIISFVAQQGKNYDTYLYEGYSKGTKRNRLTKLSQNSDNIFNLNIATVETDGYAFSMVIGDGSVSVSYNMRILFLDDIYIPSTNWSIIPITD